MLQNFVIGQYVPGDSLLHRLDPRSKVVFVFVFAFLVFMANNWPTYVLLLGFMAVGTFVGRISPGYLLRGLKPVWFLVLFTALIHLLTTKGGAVYYQWGWLTIEETGVRQAMFMAIRLALLVLISSLLTLTTSPLDLTEGMERLLAPFKKVNVPVHEIALMLSIALRFIPTLLEETDKIIKAQSSRGADFESGNLLKRARNLVPIVVPLFISAFRRAEELALAMEARGYRGGVGRTRRKQLHFTWRDGLLVAVTFVLAGLLGWWRE
ncbi:energy-coupling factor transporter transmembrane protein EcfT [Brevibacillus humidisoli]|uniref:energy-coupling factor transporter transmembrane component T family protein n=1 Tax=Brevibacillus humidisoli TaxID=2895522 RepID=UPI001E5FF327|nr:energy-coupling factor transporter transmembrane component T [Brevibacillus humidisoli]UFJ43412.1 energy-coupling factor transporter transmembrane protein EcfT [Brevibacillus humidisoli]